MIALLMTVAIVLIIAAIAIPNLVRARMPANDSAAASGHTIVVGEAGYLGTYPKVGYATLAQFGGAATSCVPAPADGCIIDNNNLAANGRGNGKSGYKFAVMLGARRQRVHNPRASEVRDTQEGMLE